MEASGELFGELSRVPLRLALISGSASLGLALYARWLYAIWWTHHLMAYRLELPNNLTHEQVSGWLTAVGASTRWHPIAIEIMSTNDGISHFMLVPDFHVNAMLTQARNMLPGLRTEPAGDYLRRNGHMRAAGELRATSTSHPLGHEQAGVAANDL
jgi:hypothetical protein